MRFYHYQQGCPGGYYVGPARHVVIRAESAESADRKARRAGMGFRQECKCCGPRWEHADDRWSESYPHVNSCRIALPLGSRLHVKDWLPGEDILYIP